MSTLEEADAARQSGATPVAQLAFLARQGIYDAKNKAVAYELLYRDSKSARTARIDDDVQATLNVIVNTALEIGLERLSEELPVHINYPSELLVAAVPPPFPPARVVIEVLESVRCDDAVLKGLASFRARGYSLALDDYCTRLSDPRLLDLVDTVKLDISQFSHEELCGLVRTLRDRGHKLIAEHVETAEELERCRTLGFDAYQGFFLQSPQMFSARPVPSSRLGALRLIACMQVSEPSINKVAALISQDFALSYRVLRCINSSYYGYSRKVESIKQAIVMLGLEKVQQLCALLALRALDNRPISVFVEAMTRAKMCEALGVLRQHPNTPSLFITGLFSTLDVITGMPMRELLGELPLGSAVSDALLTQQGPLGLILREVVAYSRGTWNPAQFRGLSATSVRVAYLEAVSWARAAVSMTAG
jgi:EAL and modified HD-GYP domain-containing signal transduction protein